MAKVKKYFTVIILILSFIITISLNTICKSGDNQIMAVAFKGGTYEKIAASLNKVSGLPISIVNTRGSDEIISMVSNSKANLGIVQMDILLVKMNVLSNAYKDSDVAQNVKFVLPLYPEEIHILARKSIKSIFDLKGKKVAVGEKHSGTLATSSLILEKIGISKNIKQVMMSPENALTALQKGTIDAVFMVIGAPAKMLSALPGSFSDKFHMIEFSSDVMKKFSDYLFHYKESTIPANTYPWQKEDVKTISVISSIIANKDVSEDFIKKMLKSIFDNKESLKNEHPKWGELNIKIVRWYLAGRTWQFHQGALDYLTPIVREK